MASHPNATRLRLAVATAALCLVWSAPSAAQIEPQPQREDLEREAREAAEAHQPVLTRAPELEVYVDPVYPEDVQADEVEGEVILLVTLSETGVVTAVEVLESPDPRLSEAALEAAHQLVFSPAEVDHVPAPVQIEFGYVFALDVQALRDREAAGADEDDDGDAGEDVPEPVVERPVTLAGRALIRGLRDPLEGAMVVSGDEVATTDADGHFELRLEAGRSHLVEVRAPGYHLFETVERIEAGERNEVVYYVQQRGTSPYETVVRAQRPRKEVSRVVISRDEAQRVPGTFGDPLRVIENLPGMARAPFIGGQLLVRGSRPEDTGVYFDGVNIPLLYHFGGLTSVVNAEFLEEIDFLPGGFGAEYGRATAGIVDVTPRRLTGQPARGSAKVDLMDTSLFYRSPVGENLAVGVAVRRSYVDVFLPFFIRTMSAGNPDGGQITLAPVYADYQLKVDWDAAPDHDVDLFVFGSQDTLELLTPASLQSHAFAFDLRLAFHRMMLGHRWRIRPDLVLRTRPFLGVTLQGAEGGEVGASAFAFALNLFEGGLRQDLSWRQSDALTLRGGLDIYAIRGWGEVDAPIPADLLSFPSPMQPPPPNQAFEQEGFGAGVALWTEAVAEPLDGLQVVPGLRLEVYRFPDATRPVFEPRLSTRYRLFDDTILKAAAGLYHKAPTIFEVNEVIGNPRLKPERSRHLVVGVEQALTDILDLDLQLFHNRHVDLVVSNSGTTVEDGEAVREPFVNRGDGHAYGAEMLLRHKITERAFGWLAYTLMRSERRSRPENDYVVTQYDQTHILTLVGSYKLGRGFEVGARFRLVTGNPYTPVIDATHDLDTDRWRPIYGPTRSERLPTFHQLDLRAEYTHTFDLWTISAFLDLLNTYNQRNVENFQYDYRYRDRVDFNGLPFFPVLGVRGQW
jgi:TonB family protein